MEVAKNFEEDEESFPLVKKDYDEFIGAAAFLYWPCRGGELFNFAGLLEIALLWTTR